jgi:UDP-N-acetylmuramoylalanine--D-glutamate ligase
MSSVKKDEIFVLELSSYQLDDIHYSPNIAVITNLFPEHMDYHGGVEKYYNAKKNIINFQRTTDTFIFNQDNKILCEWAKESKAKVARFADSSSLATLKISLIGEHNKENIRAAIAVAKEFGIYDEVIKNAIEKFNPLPHRLEFVGEFSGIKFYDDAISTTPESTIMAIKSLGDVDTIFLGGADRGYNFSELEKVIKEYNIKNIVLFPDSGKKIKVGKRNILRTKKMAEAVKFAFKYTERGKVCLLSCASPSYSLWKNFEEKGNQFKNFIKSFNEKTF